MGFILIAVLVITVVWIVGAIISVRHPDDKKLNRKLLKVCSAESAFLIVVLGGVGLFSPPTEYEEEKIDEVVELVRFTHDEIRDNGGFCYLSVQYGNYYNYYTKNGDDYKINPLITDNMMIIENGFVDVATMTRYSSKAKKSFWTFAIGHDKSKYEYVFCGPFGSILNLDYYN